MFHSVTFLERYFYKDRSIINTYIWRLLIVPIFAVTAKTAKIEVRKYPSFITFHTNSILVTGALIKRGVTDEYLRYILYLK